MERWSYHGPLEFRHKRDRIHYSGLHNEVDVELCFKSLGFGDSLLLHHHLTYLDHIA